MAKSNTEVTLDTPIKDFIVRMWAKSLSEQGADRYWELHVQATSDVEAIDKAKQHTAGWSVYDEYFDILKDKSKAAPPGSIAYREI